jgi:type I restriction enzyme, S subunit
VTTVRRLDQVCKVIMGQAPSGTAYNSDGIGWPLIAGAGDFGDTYPVAKQYTTEATRLSQRDDIILGIRASIGDKVLADGVYCLGRGVAGLRPHEELDNRYLWHWLSFSRWVLESKAKGATFKQVNRDDIGALTIPILPLREQRRIAHILDQADALRAKRRAAMAELGALAQSVFLDMFGDPATNPHGWPIAPLSSLVQTNDNINYGVVQPGGHIDAGVPLVRVGDLLGGRVVHDRLKRIDPRIEATYTRSRLRGDEILVSCVGTIGVTALADESMKGFNIARAVARIPLRAGTDRMYLLTHLRTDAVQRYFIAELRTVSQPTLNIKQLSETIVMIPPPRLQATFGDRIRVLHPVQEQQGASLVLLDTLFASLQYRAFRGEL